MKELDQLKNLFESLGELEKGDTVETVNEEYREDRCYDCGSTIAKHHTPSCDFAAPGDKQDLPQKPGTQYWTGEVPDHLRGKENTFVDPTIADDEAFLASLKSKNEAVKEDDYDQYEGHGWSGSDWYAPLKSMDEYIDKHGLSPESIMQAANNEAEFYSGPMGYRGDWDAAAQSLKDAWIRMTKRGQMLQKMFAPAE